MKYIYIYISTNLIIGTNLPEETLTSKCGLIINNILEKTLLMVHLGFWQVQGQRHFMVL